MKNFFNKINQDKIKFKLILILIFFVLIFILGNISYANLEEDELNNIDEIKADIIETSNNIDEQPKLNSKVGLIFDRSSKTILYEKNGLKQVPMASTTKIMTSIIVLENANLKETVTIDKKVASIGGSRLGLKPNDKITVNDLLYGLMLKSGNDAALALSIHIGGNIENFVNMMNKKAKEMGWNNSHFITSHGLDNQEHYTTAYELACMTDYALQKPKFKEIVGTKICNISINGNSKTIKNTHELLGVLNGVYGVKTGFTNGAGRCLVTSCTRGNLDIITVILGADTKKIRTQDSIKLIEYVYKNYQIIDLEKIIKQDFEKWKLVNEKRIYVNKGKVNEISLQLDEIQYKNMAVLNTEANNIILDIECLYKLEAPVKEKEIIGNAKIKLKERVIGVIEIQSEERIDKKGIFDYFIVFLKRLP